MCGFLGEFILENKGKLTESKKFASILALSKDRGPDSIQISRKDHYQLGFNRLSILDLSDNANQPIYSPTKRYHVVFNGEIYNYKSLAKEHGLKNLRSSSDTEVLVQLFDKLGIEDAINLLNGMFAIAVVDLKNDMFYLIRDFVGIKPLFYGISEQGIVAASQFDQVFKHTWFSKNLELKPEIIKEYFGLGYMHAPNTIYNHIFQLQPGEIIKVNRKGDIVKNRFLVFGENNNDTSSKFETKLVEPSIKDAVNRQLVSDVPLASFLSGGIDSPLITAMANSSKSGIETFTLEVTDKGMNESHEAVAYADAIGIKQSTTKIQASDFLNIIDNHFDAMPEPLGDYSSIPTYILTKEARKKFTVMLSGDGGDELFFGYPRMLDVYKHRHWFNLPFALRKPLVRIAHKLGFIKTWGPYNFESINDWVMAKQSHILSAHLNAIFPDIDYSREIKELFTIDKNNLLNSLRINEFYGHLQRVLIKVDRMSMGNSLEVRVPFLDKAVIIEAFKAIPTTFNKKSDLKAVLKSIMKNYYPENIVNTDKKGFTVPINTWLHNELKEDVKSVILDQPLYGSEHFDTKMLREFIQDFYSHKHNSAWGVWHIYAWQKWALNQGLLN